MNSRSFENIETQIKDELKKENVFEKLYNSTDYILNIINTIVETDGINWASKVMDDKGNNVLTEEEQAQFTSAFQPYINSILGFFGKSNESKSAESTMVGGNITKQDTALIKNPTVGELVVKVQPNEIPGMDEIFTGFMGKIDTINQVFKKGSESVGILKLQSQLDKTKMDPIIPFVGPVPVRTLIFALYLLIDILRVMASASGMVPGRKILSIVIAIFDLLQGDWKKAILSFMGFFTSDALIIGAVFKIFLSLFETLNPDRQESIVYGAYGTIKSLLVGIPLSILQIGAPMEGRDSIMAHIKEIDTSKQVNSWDDINNIQMIFDNPKITCSSQFQARLKTLPSFVKFVAMLLGVPEKEEGNNDANKMFNETCKGYKIEGQIARATSSDKMEEHIQKSRSQVIATSPSPVASRVTEKPNLTPELGKTINLFMETLLKRLNVKTELLKVIKPVIEEVLQEQNVDTNAIEPFIKALLTQQNVEKEVLKVVKGVLTQNPDLQKQALNAINDVIKDVLKQQKLDPTILKFIEKILTQQNLETDDIKIIKNVLKKQGFDPAILNVIEKLLKQNKLNENEFKPLIKVVLKQLGLDPKISSLIEQLLTKPPTSEKEIQNLISKILKEISLDNKQIKLAAKILKDSSGKTLITHIAKQAPLIIHT